jgi:hypothetical protein
MENSSSSTGVPSIEVAWQRLAVEHQRSGIVDALIRRPRPAAGPHPSGHKPR